MAVAEGEVAVAAVQVLNSVSHSGLQHLHNTVYCFSLSHA